jgi:hypothetical protein
MSSLVNCAELQLPLPMLGPGTIGLDNTNLMRNVQQPNF